MYACLYKNMHLLVCFCVCMCVCTPVFECVPARPVAGRQVCVCMYACLYMDAHVFMCVCVCVCIFTYNT
jgi:hypothetical protein